ncbi:MAG: hypothetical protein DMF40_05615 [Verrucomicrobia bacterium]|nr:MAG: hypothetical protein DME38_07015 [Verrucomicrobiota bacterium]PYL02121.1 MAG: hypothetical protein DME32_07425 [Verrucomicrobiota bacterium]PYL48232.1 MAG: hypothetical protein DMF40_05615 [Verrucomicrobiota bacterium]
MAHLLQYRYIVKAVCLSVLVAMLGVVGTASAVIRSPFPSRPSPPFQGRYVMIGNDSMMALPKPVIPAPSR